MKDELGEKYSNNRDDIYKNIEEYDPNKNRKILIVFDDMIVGIHSNEKTDKIINELFTRGRKLNISLAFITQSYLKVRKDVRLKTMHFLL